MLIDYLFDGCLDRKKDILDSSDCAVKLKQLEMQNKLNWPNLKLEKEEREHKIQIEEHENLQMEKERCKWKKEKLEVERTLKQQELDAKLQMQNNRS